VLFNDDGVAARERADEDAIDPSSPILQTMEFVEDVGVFVGVKIIVNDDRGDVE
jgi:hypothetical protein